MGVWNVSGMCVDAQKSLSVILNLFGSGAPLIGILLNVWLTSNYQKPTQFYVQVLDSHTDLLWNPNQQPEQELRNAFSNSMRKEMNTAQGFQGVTGGKLNTTSVR